MKISYGITVHNEADELNKLLEILVHKTDKEDEIVICVDGNDEKVQEVITSWVQQYASDDVDKINFNGMYKIYQYVKEIIRNSTQVDIFDFKKTKSDSTTTPKFKVTLGVMPDYLFDGIGMRIDGISKEKTAEKFGIIKGDIVLKMGDVDVNDMMSYMKGLSKLRKGDSTTIKLNRQEKIIEIDIIFQ